MAARKDLTMEGRDAFSIRFHFTRDGADLDVSEDVFEAAIRLHANGVAEVPFRLMAETRDDEDPSKVTFGLTSSQVEAMPTVSFWRLSRLIGGDEEAEQTILEGRVRHE